MKKFASSLLMAMAGWLTYPALAAAQPPRHFQYHAQLPPGEIGARELNRRPDLKGHFQPVLIQIPETSMVAIAEDGTFGAYDLGRKLVGLQVGRVYRLRIAQLPNHEDELVYPSIEIIDRLHPPAGKEARFPIPVEITREELELAIEGQYVTRVIYIEDPRQALPVQELPEQRYFEVLPNEDPLQLAGTLGRPVAILRIGSFVPDEADAADSHFLFDSPPILQMAAPMAVVYQPSQLEPETAASLPPAKLVFRPQVPQLPELQARPRIKPRKPAAPRSEQPQVLDDQLFGDEPATAGPSGNLGTGAKNDDGATNQPGLLNSPTDDDAGFDFDFESIGATR